MKLRGIAYALGVLAVLAGASDAGADEHLRFPRDIQPDFYHSGGPIGSLSDGEWVAIPFWRAPESIPAEFNLLDTFDPEAVDLPLLVEGFLRWTGEGPASWEARGRGAVPIWFVRAPDLQAATADGELTIGELASLDSLRVGTADFYQEQNHIYGLHQVSHYTLVSSGELSDGRSFKLLFVEVNLEFVRAKIVVR
jgi:hypothetical protein